MIRLMEVTFFPVFTGFDLEEFAALVGLSIRFFTFFTMLLFPNGAFSREGPGLAASHHASAASLVSLTMGCAFLGELFGLLAAPFPKKLVFWRCEKAW